MENVAEKFLAVLRALSSEGVDYVLVGGYAVVLHGSRRFTEDIDILIRNDEDNVRKLRKALTSVFNDENISEITSTEIANYSVIRYIADETFFIDIIGNPGEAFIIDSVKSEQIEFDGVKVNIATLESLYKMKSNTYRAVDIEDIQFLANKLKEAKK